VNYRGKWTQSFKSSGSRENRDKKRGLCIRRRENPSDWQISDSSFRMWTLKAKTKEAEFFFMYVTGTV